MSGPTDPDTASSGFLQRRLSFPPFGGNRKLLSAAVIDSLGSGLVLAFILVYFTHTTTLSLAAVGGAISLARLLAVPTAMVVGPLIDRFGARRMALLGNTVSAVGYAGFLVSHQVWQILLVTWLAQVGGATYWTSSSGLVVLATKPEGRPRWFSLMHMLRNSGLAAGGAIGALLIGSTGNTGLRWVVVANAASYAIAALLLALWRPTGEAEAALERRESKRAATPASPAAGGYRVVLRDRRYLLLVGINVGFVFNGLILSLLLAIYINTGLHRPVWIAGVIIMINCFQVALTQTLVGRWMERFRPIRVIAVAALFNVVSYGIFMAVDAASAEWVAISGLLVGILFYNFAETAAAPFNQNFSVSLAPEALRGRYLAVYQMSYTLGQTAGPGLFALLLTQGALWPWIFLSALNLLAVPALFTLERMIKDPVAADNAPAVEQPAATGIEAGAGTGAGAGTPDLVGETTG
jgi:MFS family permease